MHYNMYIYIYLHLGAYSKDEEIMNYGLSSLPWLLKDKLHFPVFNLQCKNINWIIDVVIFQLL